MATTTYRTYRLSAVTSLIFAIENVHPLFGPCLLWPMAGWIRIPLGTEVRLGPGDIVLDGDPTLPPRKAEQQRPALSAHCSGPYPRRLAFYP